MQLQHVNTKIFVDGDLTVDLEAFIKVFHRWTAEQTFDQLLIDVADYRHVPSGPGVVLIGHQADYAIDHTGGRWGLLYNRKAPLEGTNGDRFRQSFRAAAAACRLLEQEFPGALKFSRREFQLLVNDRAVAPNTPDTFDACQPEIQAFVRSLTGDDNFTVQHNSNPRRRFSVTVDSSQPFDL